MDSPVSDTIAHALTNAEPDLTSGEAVYALTYRGTTFRPGGSSIPSPDSVCPVRLPILLANGHVCTVYTNLAVFPTGNHAAAESAWEAVRRGVGELIANPDGWSDKYNRDIARELATELARFKDGPFDAGLLAAAFAIAE